ncbi:MAG: hypothetical protein FWD35_04810 [Oscillospiraceae bacterium]|nr:hypothetical protein [Oscillospiraceae bacterium]
MRLILKKIGVILLCVAFGAVLVFDAAGIADSVSRCVSLCLNTIIPSLFASLALAIFVMQSGLVGNSSRAVLIMSLLGGYPVGARLLADSHDKTRAERALMYCYCPSPVFLIAIAGSSGLRIWLSNALACVIFAIISNIFAERKPATLNTTVNCQLSIVNCVTGAGKTLFQICAVMLAFAVFLRVLEFIGVMALLPDYAYAFAEITRVMGLNAPSAVIAALTSFGGVCVLLQTAAITRGRLSLRKFALARVPIALLSAGICYGLNSFFPHDSQAVPAIAGMSSRAVVVATAGNYLASVCLLIMILMLIASVNSPANSQSDWQSDWQGDLQDRENS